MTTNEIMVIHQRRRDMRAKKKLRAMRDLPLSAVNGVHHV
jgi:hypothetical protein